MHAHVHAHTHKLVLVFAQIGAGYSRISSNQCLQGKKQDYREGIGEGLTIQYIAFCDISVFNDLLITQK